MGEGTGSLLSFHLKIKLKRIPEQFLPQRISIASP